MAFRSDTAAATLSSVLDELARTWVRLSPELQGTLDALIRTHGPQIADRAYDRFNVLSRIAALLDALWQLQARLPARRGDGHAVGDRAGCYGADRGPCHGAGCGDPGAAG